MKAFLLITFLILIGQSVSAQVPIMTTDVDTIEQFPNKTLVEYKVYLDSVLSEQIPGFLYPEEQEWPKYTMFENVRVNGKKVGVIVYHGEKTTHLGLSYYMEETYENGILKGSMRLYDTTGVLSPYQLEDKLFQPHDTNARRQY